MNKRIKKKKYSQVLQEQYASTKALLLRTLKELNLSIQWEEGVGRGKLAFKVRGIPYIVFGLWVSNFQVGYCDPLP